MYCICQTCLFPRRYCWAWNCDEPLWVFARGDTAWLGLFPRPMWLSLKGGSGTVLFLGLLPGPCSHSSVTTHAWWGGSKHAPMRWRGFRAPELRIRHRFRLCGRMLWTFTSPPHQIHAMSLYESRPWFPALSFLPTQSVH